MRNAILPVVMLACGGSTPAPIKNQAPAVVTKPAPCPSTEALTALVQKVWGAGAKVSVCVPLVRDGKALWWLEGNADPPPDTMHQIPTKNALLDERRELLWHGSPEGLGFGYAYMGRQEATDMDGDGNDEVLYDRTTGEGGMSINELIVVYFEPTPVMKSVSVGSSGDAGQQTCDGAWSVAPGAGHGKRIVVERTGNACTEQTRRETFERRSRKDFEKI